MAYDEKLATRIRKVLSGLPITEKKMFGGLCFLLDGNMLCGIVKDTLMVRVGPEQLEACLAKPHARAMDFTGRPSKGMLYVDPEGLAGRSLSTWIGRARKFVETLPAK